MRDSTTRPPLSRSLGEFAVRDIDRLNLASELLASAATSLDRLSSPSATSIRECVYQANQQILAVMKKPVENFKRWHERYKPETVVQESA